MGLSGSGAAGKSLDFGFPAAGWKRADIYGDRHGPRRVEADRHRALAALAKRHRLLSCA
jgi:hypothetical protein